MKVEIRRAQALEAGKLSEIAMDAKRFWNYPEDWIRLWSAELSVSVDYIESTPVFVAKDEGAIVGWCSVTPDGRELDYCWVSPRAAGKGIGRQLVNKAFQVAAELKSDSLKVIADPNATGFYTKMGFSLVGYSPSAPEGRKLPVMEAPVNRGQYKRNPEKDGSIR